MRLKKKGFKKVLAEFLCVALIACSIPGAAFAAEEENTGKGSVTSTYEATDGIADGQKNVAGTEVKDTSDIGEQNTGEGDVKDPDGKTGIGGEVSEGEEGSPGTSGTETKESDPEKTDPKEKGGDGEEAGDTAQDPAKEDDESDGESTEDSADKDDAEDDAGSEDNIDINSDAEEDDTDDESDAEDDEKVDAEDEDESDINDTAKGGSAAFDDEEEEDEDEEEEDWIDGPLDDELMLLTATPSDATPVAEMDGEYYDTIQDAIDEAENRSTITMVDDSTENIIISDGLILTLDLAGFTLEGNNEGSVVTIIDAELTLEDSSGDEGRITGGSSDYGGGIYISDGTFRMTGGTISENTADIYGGGVYLDSGTFTMTGGIICENTADTAGSDIYAEEGSVSILEASDMMNGDYEWFEDGEDDRYSEDNPATVCDDEDVVGASSPGSVRGLALVASDGIKPLLRGAGWQVESTGDIYDNFEEALKDATDGDTIILLDDTEEIIQIDSDKNIILDLAGHTIDGDQLGTVITNKGTLTLIDSSAEKSGCITNGSDDNGGGVYNSGTFNMEGGTISNCSAHLGGGVYNNGTFNMDGGMISNCSAHEGGGVCNDGTFEIRGGEINANTADQGGGVWNNGTFNMTGGTISECTATEMGGGGVWNNGTFNMTGSMISECTATRMGGGVRNYDVFNMTDSTISECTATDFGGGIYISGTCSVENGQISGNKAEFSGGVYMDVNSAFNISGFTIIAGNTDSHNDNSNVYLESNRFITLNGDLEEGASIGVTPSAVPTEDTPVQITTVEDSTSYYQASAQYFFYDVDSSYVGTPNETGQYVELAKEHVASLTQNGTTIEYTSVQAAVNAAGNAAGTVTMLVDSTEDVRIESGQTIILDLNGYTLTGLGDASVILNYGTLTLEDSSGDDSGRITGGTGSDTNGEKAGGGINNHGDFTMNGGTITGNNAITGGGLFNVSGTSTMNGGMIYKNSAETNGGGIDVIGGTFTLNGGTISDNTAGSYGGGIHGPVTIYDGIICNNTASSGGGIYSHMNFINIYGGSITGNSATDVGGGVYVITGLNMQGGAIYNNTAGNSAADIYSRASSSLAIIDAVTMLGNEDPEQCYKWYNDNSGNRYSPENITDIYDDKNVINAGSLQYISSAVQIIAAGDEGHIYSEDNVTFTWDGTDSCTATFTCTDCGHEETVNCDVTYETITEPTCTDAGSAIYIAIATITSRGEELTVTDEQTEEIKALGHEWVVEQTVIEDSEDRYEEMVGIKCTRCGLEYEEEIVVSTESSGVTAHSSLSWSDLLTEDDLADLFESGAELEFKMTAEALAQSDVPSADRTLAEDLIAAQWPDADYTTSWLDISVLLDIIHSTGEEEIREYNSTLNPVTITVTIPAELVAADGDTYAVIRIHSGEAAVLDTTDNGNGTLTFKSDLFSTYVIIKTAETDSGNGGSGSRGARRHSGGSSYTGSVVSGTGSIAYSMGTWTIDELGHWRYTDSSGRRYENEWGYIYNPYANASEGQPSVSWFHFGYDGIMDTGWFIDTDGKIYYLNPSLDNTQGAMFTGWVFIDGKWYYFDANGALLRNTQTPDGYTVDETGARVEG